MSFLTTKHPYMSRILLALFLMVVSSLAFAGAESVLLVKILQDNDKLLIQRRNGEQWIVTRGIGNMAIYRYEGRQVVINSPGMFCGLNSSLLLVEGGHEYKILDAEEIGSGGIPLPLIPLPPALGDKVAMAFSLLGLHTPGVDPVVTLKKYQALRKLPVESKYTPELLSALVRDLLMIRPASPWTTALAQALAAEAVGTSKTPVLLPPMTPKPEIIETNIAGTFEGWRGETLFKLVNGEIWQQSEYYYEYHYAYSPKILIVSTGGGYKAKVEGMTKAIGVTRLR